MDEETAEEHVVVAGLLRHQGRGLMVHRTARREWYPDCWDLPGGHVRAREESCGAVKRELAEELGVAVEVAGEPFARVQGSDFHMDVWVIDRWTGELSNRDQLEHDALAWMTAEDLHGRRLADPRLPDLLRAALVGRDNSGPTARDRGRCS